MAKTSEAHVLAKKVDGILDAVLAENHLSIERICDRLKAAGFKSVGSGVFSFVLALPDSNLVVKVTRDVAFKAFIKATKKTRSKYFPRVYYHRQLQRPGADKEWHNRPFDVYIIERLSSSRKDWPVRNALAVNLLTDMGLDEFIDQDDELDACHPAAIPGLVTDTRCYKAALNVMRNLDGEFCVDLHLGNVMCRGDVPVITDPVCA